MTEPSHPRFQHYCDRCIFLGAYDHDAYLMDGKTIPMKFDLYYCPGSSLGGSCIARHADEGSEYASTALDLIPSLLDAVAEYGRHSTYSEALIECSRRARLVENK